MKLKFALASIFAVALVLSMVPLSYAPTLSLPSSGQIPDSKDGSSWDSWIDKEDSVQQFISLADSYGGSYESIGKSSSSRNWDIVLFKFGNPNGGKVMVDGYLHGNEFYSYHTLLYVFKWLLTSGDSYAERILQNNYVLVVPVANYRFARTNYNVPSWMTTKDYGDGDTCGVNLNRNFGPSYPSSASHSNNDGYSGVSADSESESQALIYAWEKYNPRIYWNLHQGAGPMTMCTAVSSQAQTDAAKVKSLLPSIQSSVGVSGGWSFSVSSRYGNGYSKDGAASRGCAGFLTEVHSSWSASSTLRTEMETGNTFKQVKAMFIAMCQAVEGYNPNPPPGEEDYSLTVSVGAGSGTTKPSVGVHIYSSGTRVTLTATPSSTHLFSRWIIDGESIYSKQTEVTMSGNVVAEARFYRPTLRINESPNGTVNHGSEAIYDVGTQITLTASPYSGYNFDYWVINSGSSEDNPVTITLTEDVTVTPVITAIGDDPPEPPPEDPEEPNTRNLLGWVAVGGVGLLGGVVYSNSKKKKR